MRYKLAEFFIFEDTGRDLHDMLDVILDMAETGVNYERELMELRNRAQTLSAAGDSPDIANDRSVSLDDYISQRKIHGPNAASISKNYTGHEFSVDYDTAKSMRLHVPNLKYKGPSQDAVEELAMWRARAHTELRFAMFDVRQKKPWMPKFEHQFEQVERCIDEIEKLAKIANAF